MHVCSCAAAKHAGVRKHSPFWIPLSRDPIGLQEGCLLGFDGKLELGRIKTRWQCAKAFRTPWLFTAIIAKYGADNSTAVFFKPYSFTPYGVAYAYLAAQGVAQTRRTFGCPGSRANKTHIWLPGESCKQDACLADQGIVQIRLCSAVHRKQTHPPASRRQRLHLRTELFHADDCNQPEPPPAAVCIQGFPYTNKARVSERGRHGASYGAPSYVCERDQV